MLFRMVGLALALAVVGYMFYTMNSQNKAVESNPALQEQKQVLKEAGVDTTNQQTIAEDALKKAKEIEAFQNQTPPKE